MAGTWRHLFVAYGVELGMSAMGSDLTISIDEAGHRYEAAMGALTFDLTDRR